MRRPVLRTGVRWKISIAITAVGALTVMALSLVVHNAARVSMLDNAREVQMERLNFAQNYYETSNKRVRFGTKLNDPALPAALKSKALQGRKVSSVQERGSGPPDIWAAVPVGNGDVLSLHSTFTDRSSNVMADLDRALVIGSVAVVFGGCALGILIGGQISRRLRKAADAAGRVAEGNTDVRVRDAIGGVVRDETDELARAVDALTDALQERIEAERRVTADIAHELRTPVTGLLTAAELLPPGRPTELVRNRAQAMRTLVEDVLEVARLDSASERAELQDIALGEFVSRRVTAFDPEVKVRVVHESWVSTDPRRLERILGNLLGNAAKHGGGPVEVTVEGRVVRVRDHGAGFPEALLRDGPSRFRTGSSDRSGNGHGLGLTIAAGQAKVLGARLTFRNAAPEGSPNAAGTGGAIAVLWLPEHAPTNTGSFPAQPPGAGAVQA
ncbi:two-component system sensor histidine kinase CseC [Streptomyces sp. NPDC006530]|uniref:two-component system sensor histidine kinase CseC n=1 Tax=Streptomyces sp. NPDC006530 TaxID=3364750 RepID=UPI00367C4E20